MGHIHAHVINMTNTIYCFISRSKIKYSRPTLMGFKTARLRLAVLNALISRITHFLLLFNIPNSTYILHEYLTN